MVVGYVDFLIKVNISLITLLPPPGHLTFPLLNSFSGILQYHFVSLWSLRKISLPFYCFLLLLQGSSVLLLLVKMNQWFVYLGTSRLLSVAQVLVSFCFILKSKVTIYSS